MPHKLQVEVVSGGYKNVTLQIHGTFRQDAPTDGDDAWVDTHEKSLKLESAVWVVQEKLGINLKWTDEIPLIFMESRNSVRFDIGLHSPKDWDGRLKLEMNDGNSPKLNNKEFLIVLDFDK